MQRAYGFAIDTDTGAIALSPTVTVYDAATLNLSTIYSDDGITPLANPFTGSASTGYWFFYAANGNYDVKIESTGNPTYTLGDIGLNDNFSLNGQTGATQTFAVGTSGTDFAISSAANVHTFNLPSASAANRGVVTIAGQTFAGAKTFNDGVILGVPLPIASGGTALSTTPTNGQLLIGNGTGYTLATITGTANQVNVATGAGSTTLSLPQSIHTGATPSFTGLTISGLTGNSVATVATGGVIQETTLTNGQLLIGSTGAVPVAASLTAGSGISITPAAGAITIASTATGVATLNTLTASTQVFATGTSGTDFNISSAVSTHTFNIPSASSTNRGVVTTSTQDIAGRKTFLDTPYFEPGSVAAGALTARAVGRIHTDTVDVSMTGTTETDLMTYTLPANSLANDGDVLRVRASFITTATGGNKTLAFYLGTSTVACISTWGGSNQPVFVDLDVVRTGGATQEVFGTTTVAVYGASTTVSCIRSVGSFTATLSNANVVKFTGDGAGASDGITQEYMCLEVVGV